MSGRSTAGGTTPVVFPDINPVLLMRVHPAAESMTEAEAAAIAQGEATAAAGAEQQASQQEPGKPPEQIIPEPPATAPPTNVDVPYVSQTGSMLTCTMGNWTGEPTAYSYAWLMDGVPAGTGSASYDASTDVGKTATCVVTASNARGSAVAPPSNAVVVA